MLIHKFFQYLSNFILKCAEKVYNKGHRSAREMGKQTKNAEFVKLEWNDTRPVCYKTQDNHIGFTTVQDTVQRIEIAAPFIEFGLHLQETQTLLAKWVFEHQVKIEKAFLTLQDNRLLFLVITKSNNFDDAFEDELSDLDIELARISMFPLSVQALPNCSKEQYDSFLNPMMSFECKLCNAK